VGRAVYADVHVGTPVEGPFTYAVPEGMTVVPGMRVIVDFNRRRMTAFVVDVHARIPDFSPIKPIVECIDPEPVFNERLVDLARFTASHYVAEVGEVMALALPAGTSRGTRSRDNTSATQGGRAIELNEEQRVVRDAILEGTARGENAHLVFGVTGSGKTELYLELARLTIEAGRSVLVMVPEISLSSQIFRRIHDVFGGDLVLYHSRLTPNQRFDNWMRFFHGEARIAVGTRSAVFMPCPDLGLIVIDEEHDGSYKENSTPRYNARRLAFYRSRTENALLVMGSATPSVETLYSTERGVMRLHRLTARYGTAEQPEIDIVTVKARDGQDALSSRLRLATRRTIDAGGQAIFLLNRRGFAPVMICDECSQFVSCPQCSISLTLHNDNRLHCHYCGHLQGAPESCPACGAEALVSLGAGTQRAEEAVRAAFPDARLARMDLDSTRRKNAAADIIAAMEAREIDILLGTQMVAKGFDFHGVTLVGVLLADIGMSLPDYRATERVFSLLVQVAGRCGRGAEAGRVLVQTLNEEHRLFSFLRRHDYLGFYRYELSMRRELGYPPFTRIARLLVRGKDKSQVEVAVQSLARELAGIIKRRQAAVQLLGPSMAPLYRIAGNYRSHILLKSREVDPLRAVVAEGKRAFASRGVYLEIDIDPYDML